MQLRVKAGVARLLLPQACTLIRVLGFRGLVVEQGKLAMIVLSIKGSTHAQDMILLSVGNYIPSI